MLGRTGHSGDVKSPTERKIDIEHKSVSRQHLVIVVDSVKPGSGMKPHSRSELRITDNSKKGTLLDGVRFMKETKTLDRDEHSFCLGNDKRKYRISWRPVVLTLQLSEKQLRGGSDAALQPYRDRLEHIDVKTVASFVNDATTHVVASKRNVPKGLSALVHARYLVTDAFVDKLVEAATSRGFEQDGETPLRSPFEWDFEGSWPNVLDFVPEAGKEPHPRPAKYFAPAKERDTVLEGFTFIFADANQYESLSPPLTGGGAKCARIAVEVGNTSAKVFAQEVRKHSGKNDFDPTSDRGIVVVRLAPVKDAATTAWITKFTEDVDLELGQRSISQNEFLDAILTVNASQLKRPLEEDPEPVASTTPLQRRSRMPQADSMTHEGLLSETKSAQRPDASEIQMHENAQVRQPKKASWRDRKKATTFKGFDRFSEEESDGAMPPSANNGDRAGSARAKEDESQGLFVPEHGARPNSDPGRPAKRKAPTEEQQMDKLLPASRALKRRKGDQEPILDNEHPKMAPDEEASATQQSGVHGKHRDPGNRIETEDLRSAARSHAQARDRNHLGSRQVDDEEDEDGGDLSKIAEQLVIEEMAIPERRSRPQRQSNPGSDRWREEWNGRKNFKGFRRRGEERANRGQRVIVRLEREGSSDDHSEDDMGQTRREEGSREATTNEAINIEGESSSDIESEQIGGNSSLTSQPRGTKRTAATQSQGNASKKSKASTAATTIQSRPGQGRKMVGQRRAGNGSESSSSDDDGPRFKLRR